MSAPESAVPSPVDGIPRLGLETVESRLAEYLKPTVERLGYLGEFFQVLGHVPEAAIQFIEYTRAVKAPLADNENEVLALAVCALLGADYERVQHERLAERLGFDRDWIAAAEGRPGASPDALKPEELLLRQLALAVAEGAGTRADAEIAMTTRALGPVKTVAALLQITRFVMIARLCGALGLQLPVKSVFDEF